jgi:hypothetical protein
MKKAKENATRPNVGDESWSVSYDGAVYWDACKIDGDWYYAGSFRGGLKHFALQDKVTLICKNLTRQETFHRRNSNPRNSLFSPNRNFVDGTGTNARQSRGKEASA